MKNSENVYDIEKKEFFQHFLSKPNPSIVASLTISDQIQKLSKGLEYLSLELQTQVRNNYGALLSQSSHAIQLDLSLNSVNSQMTKILFSANKLKNQLNNQYNSVEKQTRFLENLHKTSHILRDCANLLSLTKKLKIKSDDILAQAEILYELDSYTTNEELKKVIFIQDELKFITLIQQKIQSQAMLNITNGLKQKGLEDQVILGLKIFTNFKTIQKCLDHLVETYLKELSQNLNDIFAGIDITSGQNDLNKEIVRKGPGKTPNLVTSQHFRSKLWRTLNWLITEELVKYSQQILTLKFCLSSINELNFVYSENENNIQNKFWNKVQNEFKKTFLESPQHIKQTLQENLPKLLSSAQSFEKKMNNTFNFDPTVFESLEAGYLLKCGANLKATLSSVETITEQTIDGLVKAAIIEFNAAIVDEKLCLMVANIFNCCNNDLWRKIESQLKLGPDASQCIDVPNAVQLQNVNLANIVFYHHELIRKLVDNFIGSFSEATTNKIRENMQNAKNMINIVVAQICESMIKTIGIIFLSIHREPGLNDNNIDIYSTSLYMKEFQDFLHRTWNSHIILFKDKQIVEVNAENISKKSIEFFVNNICILRPLSQFGRKRLQNDIQYFENSLKLLVPNLSSLKKSYRLLRCMFSLIIKNPLELSEECVEENNLTHASIILFLMFNHGGSDLQSPHASCNWSNEKCVQWLTDHLDDKERLELIAGALQKYRESRKSSTQYDSVYPYLMNFFKKIYSQT